MVQQYTRRILIIDQARDIQAIVKLSLELVAGWTVLTASSGHEGLTLARTENPDLILLDGKLLNLHQPNLLQVLQNSPTTQQIPVIVMVPRVRLMDRLRFRELGVSGVIAEPFDTATLAKQISGVLDWSFAN